MPTILVGAASRPGGRAPNSSLVSPNSTRELFMELGKNSFTGETKPCQTAIESHRAGADVITGDTAGRKKSIELLEELGFPKGLLPTEDIQEFGYNGETGFTWLVQGKKKVEHTFKKIMQTVSYASEVTALFAEKSKLRKITGVKTKELMLWFSVVEVYVPEASPDKVTFKTGTGLSDTFDATAFAFGQ
ncbi:uncharacterized protein [Miscanthus floridulus]|uniref:uncharacterized protein n=1 Tax=Miscanthus floridulus TaxID=154761 RepID=UPI00345A6C17